MEQYKALLEALKMVLITTVILTIVIKSINFDSNYRINIFDKISIEKYTENKPSGATDDSLK